MKNTICIDLTQYDNTKLAELAKIHNLDVDAIVSNKDKGIGKIWMDLEFNTLSAYSLKDTKDDIIITDFYMKSLAGVTPLHFDNKPTQIVKPVQVVVELDMDSVLEKITASGMSSLTKEELDFLKNQ
jgi:hypothetical protein